MESINADCEDGFEFHENTYSQGATKISGRNTEAECLEQCKTEDSCKAVDWNFSEVQCWLHYVYDQELRPNNQVNHHIKCAEQTYTAGYDAINRTQEYGSSAKMNDYDGYDLIIVLVSKPPVNSSLAINKHGYFKEFEVFLNKHGDGAVRFVVGLAKAIKIKDREYSFDVTMYMDTDAGNKSTIRNGKNSIKWGDETRTFWGSNEVTPEHVIFVGVYSENEGALTVAYDVPEGTTAEDCGDVYFTTFCFGGIGITHVFNIAHIECYALSLQMLYTVGQ